MPSAAKIGMDRRRSKVSRSFDSLPAVRGEVAAELLIRPNFVDLQFVGH